jgi:DNA-binding transcriptional LysR family regulator
MLKLYKEMEKELWPYKEEEGGLVEIGGSTIPGQYILPRIIKMFKETYPKIIVYLKVSDTQGVVEGILRGEFDLGVVGAKLKQAELFFEPCCDDEIVLIGPSYFGRDEIDLENLYELPLIKRESGSGTWKNVLQTLEERGINLSKLNIVGEMGSTEAVKAAVKEGLGLSFVSKRAIELEASLGIIKKVKIRNFQIIRKFYLVYFKNKKFSLATEKFLKFFKKILS